jgi:hypothetical protein
MFNLAIDSRLRGFDLVKLTIEGVAPHGLAIDRAIVRQQKTGHPVKFELTEQTRDAVDAYLKSRKAGTRGFLFPSRRRPDGPTTTRPYARLTKEWVNINLIGHCERVVDFNPEISDGALDFRMNKQSRFTIHPRLTH